MNVKTILAAKQRKLGGDVVSIEPTADLAAAAKLLSAHRIGAVVILGAGGRLAGLHVEEPEVPAARLPHQPRAGEQPNRLALGRETDTAAVEQQIHLAGRDR